MKMIQSTILFAVLLLSLSACGGGSVSEVKAQKKVTLAFETLSSAHSFPLLTLQMTATLPAGVTVNDTCLFSKKNKTGSVQDPVYDAINRTVKITVLNAGLPITLGPFADLTCNVTNPALPLTDFAAATIITDKQLESLDTSVSPASRIDLLTQLTINSTATYGY